MLKSIVSNLVVVLMKGGVVQEYEGHATYEAFAVALGFKFTDKHDNKAFHHRGNC